MNLSAWNIALIVAIVVIAGSYLIMDSPETAKVPKGPPVDPNSPPQVVKLEPANGATDVDPALKEIRVTFNMPMSPGFSWCGGGDHYPQIPEGKRPFWTEDKKTCVLPVSLKSNWTYNLGINCPAAQNFQSAGGKPVEVTWYNFTTQ